MINFQCKSHEFYARALLDPSRSYPTSWETDFKIAEAVGKVKGFIPSLATVNDFLEIEQAEMDPLIATTLCRRVATREDWEVQKRIYKAVKLPGFDPCLFKEMMLKSSEMKDKNFFHDCATTAKSEFSKNVDIMRVLAISYARMNECRMAFAIIKELVKNDQSSTEFMITAIESWPIEDEGRAKIIYEMAIRSNLINRKLHRVIQRFHPNAEGIERFKKGEGIDRLTAIDFGALVEEAIQQNDIKLVRRIYNKAISNEKMNLTVWERVIDFEARISKDLTQAKKLFIASPIEINLKDGPLGSELDLHGHSYGCAALMVESCIRSYKEDARLGDQFIVITGIGWKDTTNYLKMQKHIRWWIKSQWKKGVKVEVNPQNLGQLIVTL